MTEELLKFNRNPNDENQRENKREITAKRARKTDPRNTLIIVISIN